MEWYFHDKSTIITVVVILIVVVVITVLIAVLLVLQLLLLQLQLVFTIVMEIPFYSIHSPHFTFDTATPTPTL